MKRFLLVALLLACATGDALAQTVTGARFELTTGPCTLRSGSGAPASGLGAVCDTYFRTDQYVIYLKTSGSVWSELYRAGGTDVAVADGGTGLSSYTTGDLLYASGATTLAGRAAVASGSLLASAGTSNAPVWSATPSVTTLTGTTSLVSPLFTNSTAAQITTSAGNLTIAPSGDVILGPSGVDTLPNTGYTQNLGSLSNKFLTLHAAELWVETLVAQNTIATIGGRILVGATTTLAADLTSVATSISAKHNNLVLNDTVYLEADGKVEFLLVTSAASGGGPYTYTVTRNLDGTGANAWIAGDAIFNTGNTNSGFIDQYSYNSFTAAGLQYIFNFNNTGSVYSVNYADESTYPTWSPLGNGANTEVNDAIYFGAPAAWYALTANVITPIALGGGTTIVFEYWNGSTWASLTGSAGSLASVGPGGLTWTNPQSGWVATTINGVSAFWMRIRINAFSGASTAGLWRTTRRGTQGWGPTIVGNQRTATGSSTNFNAWSPRWAIGNMNGLYGYTTTRYGAGFGDESAANLTIDATDGIRFRNGSTTLMQLTSAQLNLMNTGVIKSGSATALSTGAGLWIAAGSGTPTFRVGDPAGDYLQWDGSTITLKSQQLTIDSNGITIVPTSTYIGIRSYKFNVADGRLGSFGIAPPTGRALWLSSTWTGNSDLTTGSSVILEAQHYNPSGSNYVATVSLEAYATHRNFNATADNINFDAGNHVSLGSNDLRIFTNNGSTTTQPYMRSDGNYLVIESRSTANGGTIYLGNDNNTNVNLTSGGGRTTLNRATVNTSLILAGLATCTLQVDGGGNVGCVSDSAAKTDIKSWTPGLDAIAKLRPVSYRWREGGDQKPAIGFIAQEVGDVIPEAVRRQEWGGMLTLDDRAILAALVNAVQELRKRQ